MECDSSTVMEDVCGDDMQNLEGRLVLMLLRPGILGGEVVVVAMGVMAMGEMEMVFFLKGGDCR